MHLLSTNQAINVAHQCHRCSNALPVWHNFDLGKLLALVASFSGFQWVSVRLEPSYSH